jgi:hypothetical protein
MGGTERGRRATSAAALALLAVLGIGLWVADAIARRQALERCLASGRRDCGGPLPAPAPRGYVPSR